MAITPKKKRVRDITFEMSVAIRKAIDDVCLKHDYQIETSIICRALLENLQQNNDIEIKELF